MCGFISVNTGKADNASGCLDRLAQLQKQAADSGDHYRANQIRVMQLELSASISSSKREYSNAIEMLKTATSLEEEMSQPSGPPDIVKPSHELLGEILLMANHPQEAAEAFRTALTRQPNRARSLIGLARALAKTSDQKAATKAYADFLRIWSKADPDLPELKEARDFVAKTDSRQ